MSRVKGLGYVGFEVSDTPAWDDLLGTVFGLEARSDSPAGTKKYRIDDNHHRLTLHESASDRLAYIGWEMETQTQLDTLVTGLDKDGVAIEEGDAALCDERGVMQVFVLTGPDDVRLELFYGPVQDFLPLRTSTGMAGYNTGPLGMGHVVLAASDKEAALRWYQDKLGFLLTDHIHWDGIEATFLHCNPRHHSLALVNVLEGMQGGDFFHLMLEAKSIDDVGRAYDVVQQQDYPVAFTYGRHTNDHTTSFYLYTPSGWQIEFGAGGRLVDDDTWEPRLYNSPKIWGHVPQPPPESAD